VLASSHTTRRLTRYSFQTEEKHVDKWLNVVEEQISMLPSLANKKMWDEVEDAIHGGWNVNSVLKVNTSYGVSL
jgi:hypothetical protein